MMNKKNFARIIVFFLLMSLSITSCSAFGPSSAAKKYLGALFTGNCEEIPQYLTSDNLSGSGGETEVISHCKDIYDNQIASEGMKVKSMKITDTYVKGDEAGVEFQIKWNDGEETQITVFFEREDGHWKVQGTF